MYLTKLNKVERTQIKARTQLNSCMYVCMPFNLSCGRIPIPSQELIVGLIRSAPLKLFEKQQQNPSTSFQSTARAPNRCTKRPYPNHLPSVSVLRFLEIEYVDCVLPRKHMTGHWQESSLFFYFYFFVFCHCSLVIMQQAA